MALKSAKKKSYRKAKAPDKILSCLDTGIFPAKVLFVKGFSYDEVMKELAKQKCWDWKLGISEDRELFEEKTPLALRRTIFRKKTNKDEVRLYYIFMPSFKFTDYDMCKLAHEVLHICQFMMPDFLDVNKEYEAVAYVHTYLMKTCLKKLRGII